MHHKKEWRKEENCSKAYVTVILPLDSDVCHEPCYNPTTNRIISSDGAVTDCFNHAYNQRITEILHQQYFYPKGLSRVTKHKPNDVNHHFNPYQYAIFPLKRLEFDTTYTAKVVYNTKLN